MAQLPPPSATRATARFPKQVAQSRGDDLRVGVPRIDSDIAPAIRSDAAGRASEALRLYLPAWYLVTSLRPTQQA